MEESNSAKDRLDRLKGLLDPKIGTQDDPFVKRVDQAEYKRRVHACFDELVAGTQIHLIIEQFVDMYGCNERTVYRYIVEAKKMFKRYADKKSQDIMTNNYNMLMEMYKEAKRSRNFRDATAILKEINRMYGVGTEKIDLTSGGEKLPPVTVNIIRKNEADRD